MTACKKCNKEKPFSSYYKSNKTISGYRGVCIECTLAASRKNLSKNRAKVEFSQDDYGNLKRIELPCAEELNYLFSYDGVNLIRNYSAGNKSKGCIATRKHASGYLCVNIRGVRFMAHRIIWKMLHGDVPYHLDHINRNRADNRICNIRESNGVDNRSNTDLMVSNTTGVIGVYWYDYYGKEPSWRAACGDKHIGYFSNIATAAKAYNSYVTERYGDTAQVKVEHNKAMIMAKFGISI